MHRSGDHSPRPDSRKSHASLFETPRGAGASDVLRPIAGAAAQAHSRTHAGRAAVPGTDAGNGHETGGLHRLGSGGIAARIELSSVRQTDAESVFEIARGA